MTEAIAYTVVNVFSSNANENINNIEIIIIFVIVAVVSVNLYGQRMIYNIINIFRTNLKILIKDAIIIISLTNLF